VSRLTKIDVVVGTMLGVVLLIGGLLATGVYALFHGYFDHGLFEVKQADWSPSLPRRVALVAERSDNEALSGDQYFVLIRDHIPSATELKFAYYSHDVIFRTDGDCLNVRWSDPNDLTITCHDGTYGLVDAAHVVVQKHKARDVRIKYVNIADVGK
jgi:hypothetical protein